IVVSAAAEGIELTALEVHASSRSDTRGLLGMADAAGEPVHSGPRDVRLRVRISAAGIAPERLRALVEKGVGRSPVPSGLARATPLDLQIELDG
ncbi:MAG: hypothetical protein WKG52_04955, partial [Variovorax sp.]